MAVHSALRHRSQSKAINAFMMTMLGVGTATWILCRSQQKEELDVMRQATIKLAREQDMRKAAAAEANAAPNADKGKRT